MFSTDKQTKVGNTIIYLISKVPNLFMTKALKLLYIIDETSMRETGVPVTWLEYKAWRKGPVSQELYDYCKTSGEVFSNYFTCTPVSINGKIGIKLNSKGAFDDSEFTEYETDLFDRIISKYGEFNSDKLIELLHKEGSRWHQVVRDNNLELEFDLQRSNKSNYVISFLPLIEKNEILKLAYQSAYSSDDSYLEEEVEA